MFDPFVPASFSVSETPPQEESGGFREELGFVYVLDDFRRSVASASGPLVLLSARWARVEALIQPGSEGSQNRIFRGPWGLMAIGILGLLELMSLM